MAKNSGNSSNVWLGFVGAVVIGSGIGLMTGDEAAWSSIGVGVGFLLVFVVSALRR